MAQTKRKRRSKHRGNAAGTIEARGRTGRKPTAEEQRKAGAQAREDRRFVEPTWTSAAVRACLASVMLFVLFQVGLAGDEQTIATSLILSLAAFLIYVPLGYQVDRMFWRRRMRKAGRPIPEKSR
jgi:type VI protein secretion system component VasF